MKKFVFSVYSDTAFVAFVAFLLSFALFRFYLRSFALSLALALVTAARPFRAPHSYICGISR